MRWAEAYRIGSAVEVRECFADGIRWTSARVVRKTQTGVPVVKLDGDVRDITVAIDRARDIRLMPLPAEPEEFAP